MSGRLIKSLNGIIALKAIIDGKPLSAPTCPTKMDNPIGIKGLAITMGCSGAPDM
jgi:hypothetical protein